MITSDQLTKRYYTIGEVAELFDVSTSLIRYWETVFPDIRPRKDKNGVRLFTAKKILTIQDVHYLVKQKGYTLEGAKQELKERSRKERSRKTLINKLEKIRTGLLNLRSELGMDS